MKNSYGIERDRLRLLLEITSSVTSRLDLRQMVEALSTNLFRIMRCDVSALLLPDSEAANYASLPYTIQTLEDPSAKDGWCR